MGRGGAALEEGDVDQGDHVFACEGLSFVDELGVFVGSSIEDELTCVAHDFFGDALGVAEVIQFGLVLGSAFHDAEVEIAGEFDAGLLDHVGIDQWQGSVGGDLGDVVSLEALGEGLGGGDFAIAGESAFWCEISIGVELVGVGRLLGAGDFDVAEDEDSFAGGELDVGGGVADGEADFVEEGEVGLGDTREDDGILITHG